MASVTNAAKLFNALKLYSKTYLVKKFETIDESGTRLMINHFLSNVLGFQQLEEIKTEYAIKGTYADYILQLGRKKIMVIEVKSIQTELNDNHLRQAVNYAANEGIDWVMLTNGREFNIYKVIFNKPIDSKLVFTFNLKDSAGIKDAVTYVDFLTKKSFSMDRLNEYWKRFQSLEPVNLAKYLYDPKIVSFLRKCLKLKSGITFSEEDVIDSIYKVIVDKVPSEKPKKGKKTVKKIASPAPISEPAII